VRKVRVPLAKAAKQTWKPASAKSILDFETYRSNIQKEIETK